MRVEIEGIQQGSIEVELEILPKIGETIKVVYGMDAEVHGEVTQVEHYINQYVSEQKVTLTIRPLF